MTTTFTRRRALAVGSAIIATATLLSATASAKAGTVASISAMTLAPDGALIAADWRSGKLHALTLPAAPAATGSSSFNVTALTQALGQVLAKSGDQMRVTAAVFDKATARAILAVAEDRGADALVKLALVTADGTIQVFDPSSVVAASFDLGATPGDASIWNQTPAKSFVVTDIKAHGNEILVAGLSKATFSSTFRRIPYPFDGTGSITSVEMYHAVHNQIETRAPIRAFSVVDIEGEPTVLAAYTCTPLVTAPLKDMTGGATVRGKTIAELGFGNTPLDVVPFDITYQGNTSKWVIVANSAKAADLIRYDDVVAGAKGEGLSTPVKAPFEQHAGVRSLPMPIAGVQRLLDQDEQFLLALRRNVETGDLQLVSIRKGAFFRLSDFVNEYDMPGYDYPADDPFQQGFMRPFHKMMKTDEGHSSLVK
jgi:hypothetical protein